MRLAAIAYFMACGYLIAKTKLDQALWEKACAYHDEWVRHVVEISRKELQ
jgi:hypothetical protein